MLSITSEYALRALTHLARLQEGESALGRTLAGEAGIPPNYLSKILWVLGKAGITVATRGNGGGYRLKRRPAEIRLSEIVELFDGPKLAHLLGGGADSYTAHETWRKVRSAYLNFLCATTLADISESWRGNVAESSD